MIAADLTGNKRPDIIVGYVEAPGIIFVNEVTACNICNCHLATARERRIYGKLAAKYGRHSRSDAVGSYACRVVRQ